MGEAQVITRHRDDNYETPPKLADWIVQHAIRLTKLDPEDVTVLEPGHGDTAPFLCAAVRCGVSIVAGADVRDVAPSTFLDEARKGRTTVTSHSEYSGVDFPKMTDAERSLMFNKIHNGHGFDVVATNPPFKDAEAFIGATLDHHLAPHGIAAFLLRLGFLASQKRAALYASRPPLEVWVMQSRPSFTKDGCTDAHEYGVYFWGGKMIDKFLRGNRPTALHWLASKEMLR